MAGFAHKTNRPHIREFIRGFSVYHIKLGGAPFQAEQPLFLRGGCTFIAAEPVKFQQIATLVA